MTVQKTTLQQVAPARPAAPYIGGKKRLAKKIIDAINKTDHDGYAEAFVGMGGVFLRRDKAPKTEVINDYNGEVANLFRILQRHYPQFMDMLKFQITSRREFERLAKTDPTTLTDLQRAARYLYLQRTAYGGKVESQTFGVANDRGARFNVTRVGPLLEDIHERLAGVVIEELPWGAFIKRYDRKGMLFYLDPPYFGNENDYGAGMFDRSEFEQMADLLGALKGRFILSLNDRPEVRRIFKAFSITSVSTTYSIASRKSKNVREVLIREKRR